MRLILTCSIRDYSRTLFVVKDSNTLVFLNKRGAHCEKEELMSTDILSTFPDVIVETALNEQILNPS